MKANHNWRVGLGAVGEVVSKIVEKKNESKSQLPGYLPKAFMSCVKDR